MKGLDRHIDSEYKLSKKPSDLAIRTRDEISEPLLFRELEFSTGIYERHKTREEFVIVWIKGQPRSIIAVRRTLWIPTDKQVEAQLERARVLGFQKPRLEWIEPLDILKDTTVELNTVVMEGIIHNRRYPPAIGVRKAKKVALIEGAELFKSFRAAGRRLRFSEDEYQLVPVILGFASK